MAEITNQPPDPLRINVRIVSQEGTPTQEFIRQWNQQRLSNLVFEGVISDIDQLQIDVIANADAITDIQDVDIVAGVGLDGGGNITGPSDVTVDLEDTAVTPGTYGNSTNVGRFTVDQQGRITSASNVAISGAGPGGGGGWEPVSSHTVASNVINVPLPGDGGLYQLLADGIAFSADGAELRARLAVSGVLQTGATDYRSTSYRHFATNALVSGSQTQAYFSLGINNQGQQAGEESNFCMELYGADSASRRTSFLANMVEMNQVSAEIVAIHTAGSRNNAEINDEIEFYASTGNLTGGTIYLRKIST